MNTNHQITKTNTRRVVRLILGMLLLSFPTGCRREPALAPEPAPAVVKRNLKYPVPEGKDAQGLLEFINKMAAQDLVGSTEDDQIADLGQLMQSRCEAAEMIMAGDEADVFGNTAAQIKLESLRVISNTRQKDGAENFLAYARELSKSPDEEAARYGRLGLFQGEIDNVLLPDGKPSATVTTVKTLLETETVKDRILLDVSTEAMEILAAIRFPNEAAEVADLIKNAYDKNEDEELKNVAASLAVRGKVLRLDGLLRDVVTGDRDAQAVFTDTTQAILASQPAVQEIGNVMDYAQQVENSGKIKIARIVYDQLGAALEEAPSGDDLVEKIRRGLERAKKRLDLVGHSIEVSGQTIDGKEVKWADYEGKLVVIDFWATWCGPCLAELPKLKELYDKNHVRGLEIIGVNLDTTKPPLTEFLHENDLPWPSIVHFSDREEDPKPHPIAKRYGVETIPFVVLVAPNGKVAAIHARGDRLAGEIALRIDDTFEPEKKEEEKPDKPTAKKEIESVDEEPGEDDAANRKPSKESKAEVKEEETESADAPTDG